MLKIIDTYGIDKQKRKFVEEVYELLEVITLYEKEKDNRSHLVEEFGDVMTVFTILKINYNITDDEIKEVMKSKLDRQKQRML